MENTQYQPQDPQSAPEAAMPKTTMGITSLVLGIIAIVSSWMPIVNNLSALLATMMPLAAKGNASRTMDPVKSPMSWLFSLRRCVAKNTMSSKRS